MILTHSNCRFIGIACLFSVIFLLGCLAKEESGPPSVSQITGFDITAEELYAAYSANEVAADQRFKDKVVVVSGTVSAIGKDILNDPYVTLTAKGNTAAVKCVFGKDQVSALAGLKKGQQVKIKGRCNGSTLDIVGVKECILK